MFDMFGDTVATPLPALELVDDDVSKAEMLSWEKELLGVYVSEHPFSSARRRHRKHVSALMSEITPELDGREVVIAGMVNGIRHLRDEGRASRSSPSWSKTSPARAEVTVWSDVYEPTRDIWQSGNILLMQVARDASAATASRPPSRRRRSCRRPTAPSPTSTSRSPTG